MGEVRVTLKVRGITGDFRPSGNGPTSVEALVDTGASRTVPRTPRRPKTRDPGGKRAAARRK